MGPVALGTARPLGRKWGHMELQAVETVVRRLFSDDEFRTAATLDADTALAEYNLGSDERAALMSLCDQLSREDARARPQIFWY